MPSATAREFQEEIGDKILERFGGFATRVVLPLPAPDHETLLLPSLRRVQAATAG
ncbi:MAG: hypothetical protein HYR50_02220 [Candidatus Rokubacteria bacterium]|nr:hypothetical protein [Candidatus Rokubacteria bacterium]